MFKVAFFGYPGAGKSTAGEYIQDWCEQNEVLFFHLRLAHPLYEAQAAIYKISGKVLDDFWRQDGELLNFLGGHMRKINPTVLFDNFAIKLEAIEAQYVQHTQKVVVLCDDVRYQDASFISEKGFLLCRIQADGELCLARRKVRGDLTLGSAKHNTELGLDQIAADKILYNESSITEFHETVSLFCRNYLNSM